MSIGCGAAMICTGCGVANRSDSVQPLTGASGPAINDALAAKIVAKYYRPKSESGHGYCPLGGLAVWQRITRQTTIRGYRGPRLTGYWLSAALGGCYVEELCIHTRKPTTFLCNHKNTHHAFVLHRFSTAVSSDPVFVATRHLQHVPCILSLHDRIVETQTVIEPTELIVCSDDSSLMQLRDFLDAICGFFAVARDCHPVHYTGTTV
jgi:hypothetical protein